MFQTGGGISQKPTPIFPPIKLPPIQPILHNYNPKEFEEISKYIEKIDIKEYDIIKENYNYEKIYDPIPYKDESIYKNITIKEERTEEEIEREIQRLEEELKRKRKPFWKR